MCLHICFLNLLHDVCMHLCNAHKDSSCHYLENPHVCLSQAKTALIASWILSPCYKTTVLYFHLSVLSSFVSSSFTCNIKQNFWCKCKQSKELFFICHIMELWICFNHPYPEHEHFSSLYFEDHLRLIFKLPHYVFQKYSSRITTNQEIQSI